MPGTASGSWWATARGTYYRVVTDRFSDGAMPSFGDLQFKTTLFPTKRTRLTIFGLAGREMLLGSANADPGEPTVVSSSNRGDNRIAAATLRWMPSSRFSSATTVSAYSTSARLRGSAGCRPLSDFGVFDRRMSVQDVAVRQQLLYASSPGYMYSMPASICIGCAARGRWTASSSRSGGVGVGPSTWGELVDYSAGPDRLAARADAGGRMVSGPVRLPERLVTIEPGVRVDWNSFTGETAGSRGCACRERSAGRRCGRAYSTQAQTPSHESLQGFEFLDFSDESATRAAERAYAQQVVAGFERPIGAGLNLRVEALPPHVRSASRAAAGNRGRAPASPCRLRSFPRTCRPTPSSSSTGRRCFPRAPGRGERLASSSCCDATAGA